MIELNNLSVSYGDTEVVKSVSLDIAKGESFALVGESGSGKSTILKAISGQEKQRCHCPGTDARSKNPAAR